MKLPHPTLPGGLSLGVVLVVGFLAGFLSGRFTTEVGNRNITGVVQGTSASGTAIGFTPDGGTGTSYPLVPDPEGIANLKPGKHVVISVATLPDGSSVIYRIQPSP